METSKLNNLHAHFFLLLWSVDLHIKNLALILPKILLSGAIQIEDMFNANIYDGKN